MKGIFSKYYSAIVSLILLVLSFKAEAQRPAIDSVPPLPPFSKTLYWEPEHISDYTWKKYNKVNVKQIIQKASCNPIIDSGKIINFTKDGWVKGITENNCVSSEYYYRKITEIKEITFPTDKHFRVNLQKISFSKTDTLIEKINNEYNELGLITKTIEVKNEKDTIKNLYFYDNHNHFLYGINVVNSSKADTFFNSSKYMFLRQNDTVIVFEYNGILDSVIRYTTANIKFDKPTEISTYKIAYIYYFDKKGKLLGFEKELPSTNLCVVKKKRFFLLRRHKTQSVSYLKKWTKYSASILEEIRDQNSKFIYY